ncbi:MAG TPA: DNA recombination protein RmuC [Bacteroidales bacterium]|jgi:DNA recombination protein RmuC|nr:DNA recombination protein RmuC [Bacteroidales bacterium]
MEIVYLLLGIAIGAALVWIILRSKSATKLAVATEKTNSALHELVSLKSDLNQKQEEILQLNNSLTASRTDLKNLETKLREQKEELVKLRETFNLEFKNLANEILEEKTKKFTEQNKNHLDEILKPFSEKIKDFEKKVEETYDKEAQQRFSLKEQVKQLAELNQQISKEANSLTQALKGESKTQGNWGEVILESILEHTGLRKGIEYTVQESFTLDDGKRFQPDVIVHYPGDRSVVIDSKVSLTAYERYASAEEEMERQEALKAHLLSVRNHINELSDKKYEDLEGIKTLDFVMLFMPVEPAYLLAIQNDPQLWTYAYERRILLISPTNLVAVLKMVESLWKQEYQSRNVLEIARQGGGLYDSFVLLSERLLNLGRKMEDATKLYRETMQNLSNGKGNLIGRVEKLKALGIKAKKQLPDSLLKRAIDEGEEENSVE